MVDEDGARVRRDSDEKSNWKLDDMMKGLSKDKRTRTRKMWSKDWLRFSF